MTQPEPKKSDLPVRAASALVMVAVAGTALWLGGWVWTLFVAAVALGVLWEFSRLVTGFSKGRTNSFFWIIGALFYVGLAASMLLILRSAPRGELAVLTIVASVIGTDIGAYFAGRTFGGPKIAPRISPSKTWSGLAGGTIGAGLAFSALYDNCLVEIPVSSLEHWKICAGAFLRSALNHPLTGILSVLVSGALIAITAQTGDFFESWMKRRAGVKDSGNLIPGHGGLFDRVDGLLAVCFVLGLLALPGLLTGQ